MGYRVKWFLMAVACAILPFEAASASAANVTVVPSGRGVFIVQGTGLTGVAAMDVTIAYDAATLSNPVVASGSLVSGGMAAANSGTPGILRLAIITTQPITGAGPIATVTFEPKGGSGGRILSLEASLSDEKGKPMDVVSSVGPGGTAETAPPPAGGDPAAESIAASAAKGGSLETAALASLQTAGGGDPVRQEGVTTVPTEGSDGPAMKETAGEATLRQEPPPMGEATAALAREPAADRPVGVPPAPETERKGGNFIGTKGVVDRFRDFAGERNPKNLVSLVLAGEAKRVTQHPTISLSDGATAVRITVETGQEAGAAPNIVLSGARLTGLTRGEGSAWHIDVVPDKGTILATLTVGHNGIITEVPLAVAPPAGIDLDGSGKVNEADFTLFLKERGAENVPRFDLNGDGVRNYLDDYIFTANFIVQTDLKKKPNEESPAKPKAKPKGETKAKISK